MKNLGTVRIIMLLERLNNPESEEAIKEVLRVNSPWKRKYHHMVDEDYLIREELHMAVRDATVFGFEWRKAKGGGSKWHSLSKGIEDKIYKINMNV